MRPSSGRAFGNEIVGAMSVIDWACDLHRRRRGGSGLVVSLMVDRRCWPPATNMNVEVFLVVVVATHDGETEGSLSPDPEPLGNRWWGGR
jgi:hypothetical protein